MLAKIDSTNYNTQWVTPPSVPIGGTTGQALIKTSATDYATAWQTLVPTGGTTGQVFTKASSTNYDAGWVTPVEAGLQLIKTQTIGTAVSTVVVNDAFSADYDNYKIIVSDGVGSAEQILGLRLGAVTTAYFGALVYSTYATATPVAATNNNNAGWTWVGSGSTVSQSINAEISSPFLAKRTFISAGVSVPATAQWAGTFNGFQNSNTSFTGFTIFTNVGTITGGTVYVYGYRKA
jgi:hypothetical protein